MTSKDLAAQQRILTHMNADHTGSLSLYLQHYSNVPADLATPPSLTSITHTQMTILDASGTAHSIPINPPLTSWAQAREAAVRMDREARAGLGLDGVTVTRYLAPRGIQGVIFALCSFTLVSIALRGRIVPGTAAWRVLEGWFPGGAGLFVKLVGLVAWPMIVLHVGEAAYFARKKVARAGVRVGSGLWWLWVGSCAVEGMGAMFRFDGEVRRLKLKEH